MGEGEGNSAAAEPREIVSELRNILNQTIQAHKQQNYAEDDALAKVPTLITLNL
jgi:hypothetical protein